MMVGFIATTAAVGSDVRCQQLDLRVRLDGTAVKCSWPGMGFCGGNDG